MSRVVFRPREGHLDDQKTGKALRDGHEVYTWVRRSSAKVPMGSMLFTAVLTERRVQMGRRMRFSLIGISVKSPVHSRANSTHQALRKTIERDQNGLVR